MCWIEDENKKKPETVIVKGMFMDDKAHGFVTLTTKNVRKDARDVQHLGIDGRQRIEGEYLRGRPYGKRTLYEFDYQKT